MFETVAKSRHNSQVTREYYDNWSNDYEEDVTKWGYSIPYTIFDYIQFQQTEKRSNKTTMIDIGCSTGISGSILKKDYADLYNKCDLVGVDFSSKSCDIAREKGEYKEIIQWDLKSFPYPFDDNTFDVLLCTAVLTYIDKQLITDVFNEFNRITKNGALIIITHRNDYFYGENDQRFFQNMEDLSLWKPIKQMDHLYYPQNSNYTDEVQVQLYMAQNVSM